MVKSDLKPEMDGRKVTCIITRSYIEGMLVYQNGTYYILNNIKNGNNCWDKKGYLYSWEWDSLVSDCKFIDSSINEV